MQVTAQIDGCAESEFRRSIEAMLRAGDASAAVDRLRPLVRRLSGDGNVLPARFGEIGAEDIEIAGWDSLAERLTRFDRPDHPVTALSIDISFTEDTARRPGQDGLLKPCIETNYYSDDAYPFSQCDHESLLDGYSAYGTEWQGSSDHVDTTISIKGIDDLYGALVSIDDDGASGLPPTPEEEEAWVVGSCYLAVLMHLAICNTIEQKGLPRPLAIFVGSDESYPFFDAPVISFADAEERYPAAKAEPEAEPYSSLSEAGVSSPFDNLEEVMDDFDIEEDEFEAEEDEDADEFEQDNVASLTMIAATSFDRTPQIDEVFADDLQQPHNATPSSGYELRRRIVAANAPHPAKVEAANDRRPGFFARLFGRA